MRLLTFILNVNPDGCVDHQEGIGPTLYQSGLPSTRRLELISTTPLRNGAIAVHYRRTR